MTTTTEVATRNAAPPAKSGKNDVRELLARYKNEIASVLPRHLTPERMIRVALTAVNSTPKLLSCTRESLMSCILSCAALGLEPGATMGHAYLIPYGDKATLIIGYKGLLDLARRSGQVLTISANNVYSNEEFTRTEGMKRDLVHVPKPPSVRGDYIGTYAVAELRDGAYHFEWMWAEEIDLIRKRSKSGNAGPWVDYTDEMRRKTAIRRLVKYLPISVELSRAASIDEAHELGLPSADIDLTEFTVNDDTTSKTSLESAMAAKSEKPIEQPKVSEAPAEKRAEFVEVEPAPVLFLGPHPLPIAAPAAPSIAEPVANIPDPSSVIAMKCRAVISRQRLNSAQVRALAAKTIGRPDDVSQWSEAEATKMLEAMA